MVTHPCGDHAVISMASRKRKAIDLDTKYQILQAVDKNDQSKTEIAKAFEIPPSTLSTIIKQRETIMKAYNSSDFGSSRKKTRTAQHTDVEDALFEWFKNVRDQNIPIFGPTLAANTDDLAIHLGHTDFTANHNWVERFKQRRRILSCSINGESANVDETVVEDYVNTTLPTLLRDYDPTDVFNMDGTGLFYKLLPNRTLRVNGERCHGGKKVKKD